MSTNSVRARLMPFAIIVSVLMLLDQLTKLWVLDMLLAAPQRSVEVTGFFSLTLVYNYGISFGMLAMPGTWMPYVLKAIAVGISVVLVVMTAKSPHRMERIAYAFIVAGALGNVIDRLRYGAVVDFFYFHVGALGWPAFNVADSCIFMGVCYLVWQTFFVRSSA